MDSIVMLSPEDRSPLIRETAERMGLNPSAVEKDFWVVWVLGRLFASDLLADKILFKGGTSLSKVFGLIRRFSEDIDLILDWNCSIRLWRSRPSSIRLHGQTMIWPSREPDWTAFHNEINVSLL